MNPYLKDAKLTRELRNVKIDPTLPMYEFIVSASKKNPQWYGAQIPKKIIEDNKGKIFPMNPREDQGDAHIPCRSIDYDLVLDRATHTDFNLFIEFKTTLTDNNSDTQHRITHVRWFQNITHYVICLVDQDDNFKSRFYFLPKHVIVDLAGISAMNNTKIRNEGNTFVDTCFTIKKEKAYEIFGKHNLLRGTSYQDLCDYINYVSNREVTPVKGSKVTKKTSKSTNNMTASMYVSPIVKTNKRTSYEKAIKFALDVNGKRIQGETNRETIIMFANHVGPLSAMDFFSKTWLSTDKNEFRNVKLNLGNYYLNPKLSNRDLKVVLRRGAKRSKIKVDFVEL